MDKFEIFKSKDFGEVRMIMINNEPWFVGKDIAMILGYADPNKSIAMHVDEDDKLNEKNSVEFRTA